MRSALFSAQLAQRSALKGATGIGRIYPATCVCIHLQTRPVAWEHGKAAHERVEARWPMLQKLRPCTAR